jgi:hypothetical protein
MLKNNITSFIVQSYGKNMGIIMDSGMTWILEGITGGLENCWRESFEATATRDVQSRDEGRRMEGA